MSKAQDSATHKGTGCLRAARHTCPALWLPLPGMAVAGAQVTGGCAGQAWSRQQRPPAPALPVPEARPSASGKSPRQTATTKADPEMLTQSLLPGPQRCVAQQGRRPKGETPQGRGGRSDP